MRRYAERYEYDVAGNFLQVIHEAANGNWTRNYEYQEPSPLDPLKQNNRLSRTTIGSSTIETFAYDVHGNLTRMSHMPRMDWDYRDQLQSVDLAGGGKAYYVYDVTGRRTRKVVEKNGGALIEERLYLGGFEVFRRRNAANEITLERQTLHVVDLEKRIALVETRTAGH